VTIPTGTRHFWSLVEAACLHATIDGSVAGRIGGVLATAGYAFEL